MNAMSCHDLKPAAVAIKRTTMKLKVHVLRRRRTKTVGNMTAGSACDAATCLKIAGNVIKMRRY